MNQQCHFAIFSQQGLILLYKNGGLVGDVVVGFFLISRLVFEIIVRVYTLGTGGPLDAFSSCVGFLCYEIDTSSLRVPSGSGLKVNSGRYLLGDRPNIK